MQTLIKTFNSITSNRRLQGFLVLSVALTFCVTSAIVSAAIWGLNTTQFFETSWLEKVADIAGGFGAIVVGLIITPALMPLIASIFEEPMLKALAKETDTPAPASNGSFIADLFEDLRFLVTTIVLNVLFIPLYFIPGINVAVYYVLNGYLLGREFFTTVEANYSSKRHARSTYKAHKSKLFGYGIILAFIATLPVLNWFLPVFALTLMFHVRLTLEGHPHE